MHKPKCWLLYGILPLMAGLFWLDSWMNIPSGEHQWLEGTIVLVGFGLMALWTRANQAALANEPPIQLHYLTPVDTEDDQALPLNLPPSMVSRDPQTDAQASPLSTAQYKNN